MANEENLSDLFIVKLSDRTLARASFSHFLDHIRDFNDNALLAINSRVVAALGRNEKALMERLHANGHLVVPDMNNMNVCVPLGSLIAALRHEGFEIQPAPKAMAEQVPHVELP